MVVVAQTARLFQSLQFMEIYKQIYNARQTRGDEHANETKKHTQKDGEPKESKP
jgi:hypothetical protein